MNRMQALVRTLDRVQQRHAWLGFPVAVWKKFGDDQAGNLAALVAYFAFVAIFPLLLVLVSVLGIVLKSDPGIRANVENSALAHYPVIGPELKQNLGALPQSGAMLAVGLVGLFLGARGVANAFQNALNTAWEVPFARRPRFPWSWLRSISLILVVGLGEIGTTILSGIAGGTGHLLSGAGALIGAVAVSLVLNFALFWVAFRLSTASVVGWRDLRLGAAIAAIVWQVLQTTGGYIVAHQLHRASTLYGTFGIVLGLIAWLYLQAEFTMYAVEANVVQVRRLWPRSLAGPPYTEQDRRAFRLYAQVEQRDKEMDVSIRLPEARGGSLPAAVGRALPCPALPCRAVPPAGRAAGRAVSLPRLRADRALWRYS
jgi:membrane protein